MSDHKIYKMSFARVYPLYIKKLERKGRTQDELDQTIAWLTGYDEAGIKEVLSREDDFETFFNKAPKLNPDRKLITGVICGVRVEDIEETLMQEIRYMDKLVDELCRDKALEKVLRRA